MSGTSEGDALTLRKMQMVAAIADKRADTAFNQEQRCWEP
jgi:hypothetical protein